MERRFKCCICGNEFEGFGNNPYPLCDVNDYDSRCCDDCNNSYVIPCRIAGIDSKEELLKLLMK